MKKLKTIGKRSLSLLLCLVMCVGLLQVTAFAEDTNHEVTSSEGAALIPEGTTPSTDTQTEGNTTTTTTDHDWSYTDESQSSQGVYGDKQLAESNNKTQSDIVDTLTGDGAGDDLDNIADGTYTKVEEQTKQDVDVTVAGSQHREDTQVVDGQGRPIEDSFNLNGSQTTTTTTTDSTLTTTTEVTKSTEENVTEKKGGEVYESGNTKTDTTVTNEQSEDLSNPDEINVQLGNDLFNDKQITSDELTVSGSQNKNNASSGAQAATEVNADNVKRDLLTALDGWTVTSDGQTATIKVDDNGNVSYVDHEGNPVENFTVNVEENNGTYSLSATKVTTTITDPGEEKTLQDNSKYYPTESGFRWGDEEYVEGETVKNPDGSTTVTYVKTGTANRTDIQAYYKVTTRTDGKREVTQYANVSATLTNGEYIVNAGWNGVTDNNDNNDDVIVKVLGPSGTVIGYAIQSRKNNAQDGSKEIVKHIIIASAHENDQELAEDPDGVAAGSIKLEDVFLQSSVAVKDAAGNGASVWLRRMKDDSGNYFYVYCAEHGKETSNGVAYDIVNIDEQLYKYKQNANHIQYVVENGWWGTDTGVGSLSQVQTLAQNYDSSIDATKLDEGIAMAATQAAIWFYSSGSDKAIDSTQDVFTRAWSNSNGDGWVNLDDQQKAAAMALFKALIQEGKSEEYMAGQVNQTTDLIHKDDIVSTSVQVVNKVDVSNTAELDQAVKDSLANYGDAASTKDLYQADVSVTLAVVPSKLNSDNLVVYVYSGNTRVGSKTITKDNLGNGKVTIENVVLENGQNVRFHLDGIQNLTEGAYLFSTPVNNGESSSQTMVGYVKGSTQGHKVDLDVSMTFNVEKTQGLATGNADVNGSVRTYDETVKTTTYERYKVDVEETHEQTVTVTTTVTELENSNRNTDSARLF